MQSGECPQVILALTHHHFLVNSPGAVAEHAAGAVVVDGLDLGNHRQGDLLGRLGADVEPDGAMDAGEVGVGEAGVFFVQLTGDALGAVARAGAPM